MIEKFYAQSKFFETLEEMTEFLQKWPDEPFDLNYYHAFLNDRFREAQLNVQANPEITNRTIFKLLRMNTDWTEEMRNDE